MFERRCVLGTIDATTQDDVFFCLATRAVELGVAEDVQAIVSEYKSREKEASTGFTDGVAIPHAKSKYVLKPVVMFARMDEPVEWNSIDGQGVRTVISILVPEDANTTHLHLLSSLSRKLVHKDFVEALRTSSEDEVFELISSALS